jgi:hypothetical protein
MRKNSHRTNGLLMVVGTVGLILTVQTAGGGSLASAAPTAPGSITGGGFAAKTGVFRDIDADGVWDTAEPGQGGITVTATCVADDGASASSFDDIYAPPTTTTTAADGSYSLGGANVRGQCRVEFAIPAAMQSFLQPGADVGGIVRAVRGRSWRPEVSDDRSDEPGRLLQRRQRAARRHRDPALW